MNNFNSGQGQGWQPPTYPSGQYQPQQQQRPRLSILFIVIMILLAVFIPYLGPFSAIVVGLLFLRRIGSKTLLTVGAIMLVMNILIPPRLISGLMLGGLQKDVERMTNDLTAMDVEIRLSNIKHALRDAAIRGDLTYPEKVEAPEKLSAIVQDHDDLTNPVTGKTMRQVPFGTEPCLGEFTYVPYKVGGAVKGFYLIGYRIDDSPGEDVNGDGKPDHVAVVLFTDTYDEKSDKDIPGTIDGKPMPPLKDLLNIQAAGS
jgi:hypothetical protein